MGDEEDPFIKLERMLAMKGRSLSSPTVKKLKIEKVCARNEVAIDGEHGSGDDDIVSDAESDEEAPGKKRKNPPKTAITFGVIKNADIAKEIVEGSSSVAAKSKPVLKTVEPEKKVIAPRGGSARRL